MSKYSKKENILHLTNILTELGITRYVISPGSRNAPLIKSFTAHPDARCHSVVDERSAGYFAVGMALKTRRPVGLVCTSGTATINFGPALAEAYYQKIPLIAITADRPEELIDQREGQSIRQKNLYSNFVKTSCQLPQEPFDEDRLWYNDRLVSEAVNTALISPSGPVHINVPLREPLYESIENNTKNHKTINITRTAKTLETSTLESFAASWNNSSKIMILTGVLNPSPELDELLKKLAEFPRVSILSERTSNLFKGKYHHYIDRLLNTMPENKTDYSPDLLLTIGTDVVSKQVKTFLRNHKPQRHWHIEETTFHTDTYKSLTDLIPVQPVYFLKKLQPYLEKLESNYSKRWEELEVCAKNVHEEYTNQAPWSDFKAFEQLHQNLPSHSVLHLGNSTPVRYALLFPPDETMEYYANRGTSGIDGVISTAAGFAFLDDRINTVVTGDLSFFYDSNGLWNKHLPRNLRIIVINNQGGSIFRIIPGPDTTDVLEEYFETRQELNIRGMAEAYGLKYYLCNEQSQMADVLRKIYQPQDTAVVVEVRTPGKDNDKVLKNYFKKLKGEL
ncbi:MAG: 2-succinyl-5-enolpyruvyl-6-hydroxy-3-cyclohexene-1-carboxylic-acid synthase [Bacteroidales bacterium]|nr:2-succinyl-5-enolpyruvyl-6-hydroxy-3-cyclohexene-1-carboxylic-acid synthase [Bacteroidales bacterium]